MLIRVATATGKTQFLLIKKILVALTAIILLLLNTPLITCLCYTLCVFSSLNSLVPVLLLLQVVHIFFYFSTLYQSSKYTSAVRFFWIRVFTVFWALEFYLLSILMFLFFIAPAELPFF